MNYTLAHHYDITWLVLIVFVALWLTAGDLLHAYLIKRRERQSRNKLAHLTRYSFNHPNGLK